MISWEHAKALSPNDRQLDGRKFDSPKTDYIPPGNLKCYKCSEVGHLPGNARSGSLRENDRRVGPKLEQNM